MLLGAEMKDFKHPVAFSLKFHSCSLEESLLFSVPMAPCTTLSIVYITCVVSVYLSCQPPLKCKLHEDKNCVCLFIIIASMPSIWFVLYK